MKRFIIKETIIRKINHPAYINEWIVGKGGWADKASLPIKYAAREHGWSARSWAERRIAEMKLSDESLLKMYPDRPYTKRYEIVEVAI